jgi:galactokinase
MDQYASMFGQKDSAILLDCENLEAKTIKLNLQDYSLLLINTNVKHSLAESAYNERRSVCERVASKLGFDSLRKASSKDLLALKESLSKSEYQKALYVIQENNRVLDAFEAITKNDIRKFGELLFASHSGLKNQYEVSCKELDFLVNFAKNSNSVIGARMMGGGFGGCTINLIKTKKINAFKKEIASSYYNTFENNCSFYEVNLSDGTKTI